MIEYYVTLAKEKQAPALTQKHPHKLPYMHLHPYVHPDCEITRKEIKVMHTKQYSLIIFYMYNI